MPTTPKLLSVLLLLGSLPFANAATVALNDWTETGRVGNNTFTANGSAGFTELFGGPYVRPVQLDTVNDTGAIATFASPMTLNATTNQLRFSFTVESILATGAGSNNAFRVGFESDRIGTANDSTMHYQFGYGPTNRFDTRFAGASGSNNEYAQGTATPSLNLTGATPLMTGNTSNITVTLTYLSDAGGGNHNYQAEINWDGQIHTNSTIVRSTDTWDKIYVVSDQGNVNVAGDTYTVSNVQVTTIPEPTASALLLVGLGGFFLRRHRGASRMS